MSLAVLYSRALSGMEAPPVTVEVHLANGLPNFTIVGLPEVEVNREQGPGALRPAQLPIRIPRPPHYRQPRASRPAQRKRPLRPADRARHSRGLRAKPGQQARRV